MVVGKEDVQHLKSALTLTRTTTTTTTTTRRPRKAPSRPIREAPSRLLKIMGASFSSVPMGVQFSSYFGWVSVSSANIPSKPNLGDFLGVRLLETTGLPDHGPLYCRMQTCRLWEELCEWSHPQVDNRSIVGIVRGAPGTGKSTTTFAWLQRHVLLTGKSVSWYHVTDYKMVHRVDFVKSNDVLCYKKAPKEGFHTLAGHIEKCSADVLVVDGFRDIPAFENAGIRGRVRIWAGNKPGKRTAVIVSSYAFKTKIEEKEDLETRVVEFQKLSWDRAEYLAAHVADSKRVRPDPDFGMKRSKRRRIQLDGGDDEALAAEASDQTHTGLVEGLLEEIDEKYYYAGGCARYFFGFSVDEVQASLKDAVDALSKTDVREVLQRGSSHPESRHRLVAFFEEGGVVRKRIVSQYAVRLLVEHMGEDSFPFLYSMGSDNPSFEGWVFEADFFFQYERAREKQEQLILNGNELNGEVNVKLNSEPILTFDHDDMVHKVHGQGGGGHVTVEIDTLPYRELQIQCGRVGLLANGKAEALRERLRAHNNMDGNSQMEEMTASKRLEELRDNLRRGVSTMWKPKKWNQGGYDSFYVFPDPKNENSVIIWFFQVTRGASHGLKMKFFVEVAKLFLDAGLQVSDCQIYFVVPAGKETRVASVTPHGNLFYEKFGWVNGKEKEMIHVVTLGKTTSVKG